MNSITPIFLVSILLVGCAPTTALPSSTPTIALPSETPTIIPFPIATATESPLISTPIVSPPPIEFALYAYDRAREELVQFGGVIPDTCVECDATWVWDGTTWTQRQPPNSPPGRMGKGFVYDEAHQNAVLFGSLTQLHQGLNDTWVWDGQNWIEKHPKLSPSPRVGMQMVYDSDRKVVVLFGGIETSPKSNSSCYCIPLNETWIWDGENWKQAHPKDSPPEGVAPITMTYDRGHHYTVLYEALPATWTWDGNNWTEQHPAHSPDFLFDGVMGYDEIAQQLIFVGQISRSALDNITQTWVWNGSDWIQVKTQLQLDLGSQPHLFFDTKYQALLLYVVNSNKSGVTGFSMWLWKDNDWTKIY